MGKINKLRKARGGREREGAGGKGEQREEGKGHRPPPLRSYPTD